MREMKNKECPLTVQHEKRSQKGLHGVISVHKWDSGMGVQVGVSVCCTIPDSHSRNLPPPK